MKAGNETMPTYDGKDTMVGNEGDGYVKITYLGTVTECSSHTYGSWITTTQPTCVSEGIQTKTCTVCGAIQTQTVAATGVHNYVNGVCTICGAEQSVLAGQKATTTLKYSDGADTAVIPAGFTVSGASSENVIDNGLVIYLIQDKTESEIANINWNDATTLLNLKKTYDQFVWIPMPKANINDMYMCQSETGSKTCQIGLNSSGQAYCSTHSSTAMAGRLYATSLGNDYTPTITTQKYTSGSGLREPDIVTTEDENSSYLGQLNGILGTSYSTASAFKTDLQSEYNEIVKSVYENEGFYIGRYETSGMVISNTNVAVKIVAGSDNSTNSNISSVTWYRMYAQQKKYASNKGLTGSIGSTMIQGAAYDQVMKFIDPTTSFVKTIGRVAHNLRGVYQTGGLNYAGTVTYNDVAKNIYDLEGNVLTWTTEAYNSDYRVNRGGNFWTSNSPSYRLGSGPGASYNPEYGAVCQLYIK